MGRRVDVDDLLNATEVAQVLGLAGRQVVSKYASRYQSFPQPLVIKSGGHTQLWAREDVERWGRHHRPADPPGPSLSAETHRKACTR